MIWTKRFANAMRTLVGPKEPTYSNVSPRRAKPTQAPPRDINKNAEKRKRKKRRGK